MCNIVKKLKKLLQLVFIILLLEGFIPVFSSASSKVLLNAVDASYVKNYETSISLESTIHHEVNYHEEANLYVCNWSHERSNETAISFLKFDLSEIPNNSTIQSVILKLHTANSYHIDDTLVSLHYCPNNSWLENIITWDNKPNFDEQNLESIWVSQKEHPMDGKYYSWNVTNSILTAFEQNKNQISFALTADHKSLNYGGTDPVYKYPKFYSNNAGGVVVRVPKLEIIYAEQEDPIKEVDTFSLPIGMLLVVAVSLIVVSTFVSRKRSKKQ